MKFTIVINQKQLVDMGLTGIVRANHIAIMEVISHLFAQPKVSKIMWNDISYVWASPRLLSDELPFFDISQSRVRHLVSELVDIGFLDRHPDNEKMGRAYVTFGERYEEYIRRDSELPCPKTDTPLSKNGHPPCPKTDTTNTTIENNTKEVIEAALKFQEWIVKKMDYVKIHPPTVIKIPDLFKKLLRAGYTKSEIQQAVEFGTTDEFWRKQFLSPMKLDTTDKNGVKFIDVFLANSKLQASPKPQPKSDKSSVAHLKVYE